MKPDHSLSVPSQFPSPAGLQPPQPLPFKPLTLAVCYNINRHTRSLQLRRCTGNIEYVKVFFRCSLTPNATRFKN